MVRDNNLYAIFGDNFEIKCDAVCSTYDDFNAWNSEVDLNGEQDSYN